MGSKPFVCTVTSPKCPKRHVIISSSFEISGRRRPKFVLTAPAWAPPLKIYCHYWLHWNFKCNFHNFLCSLWRKFRQHVDISVPVAECVPSYKHFFKWLKTRESELLWDRRVMFLTPTLKRNFCEIDEIFVTCRRHGDISAPMAECATMLRVGYLMQYKWIKIRGCELFWDRCTSCWLHPMTLYFHPKWHRFITRSIIKDTPSPHKMESWQMSRESCKRRDVNLP